MANGAVEWAHKPNRPLISSPIVQNRHKDEKQPLTCGRM